MFFVFAFVYFKIPDFAWTALSGFQFIGNVFFFCARNVFSFLPFSPKLVSRENLFDLVSPIYFFNPLYLVSTYSTKTFLNSQNNPSSQYYFIFKSYYIK